MPKKSPSTLKRQDAKVRRVVVDASPNVTFEEGADTLLRLGCLLFLEKLAKEAHDTARLEETTADEASSSGMQRRAAGGGKITATVIAKAAKASMSDVRQFS